MKGIFCSFAVAILLSGCTSPRITANPGLQPVERHILRRETVWLSESGPYGATPYHPTAGALGGDPNGLQRFFQKSRRLDGEIGETYEHDLLLLLFELGDPAFARAVTAESSQVRRTLYRKLDWVLENPRVYYPQTKAALLQERERK